MFSLVCMFFNQIFVNYRLNKRIETLEKVDVSKNVLTYEGRTFIIYGLEGAAFVNKDRRFPVYYPIFIEDDVFNDLLENTRERIINDTYTVQE